MQVMDTDGYILHVNEAFTHALGYTNADLRGKHCRVLFTLEDQKMNMPEMEIEKVNQHSTATDRNYIIHKDGTCVWASGESLLARNDDGTTIIIKLIQIIHEQKLLEKFLKESHEFAESVVRSITDAVVVIDANKRIVKANNSFYHLFNINLQSIEGLYLMELNNDFLSSENTEQHLSKIIDDGVASQFQFEHKNKDGIINHYLIKSSFIEGKLVNRKILLVISDITDKAKAEQQRDDLIAFVIHELRNPLSNITLCNTLIEQSIEESDKESAEAYLNKSNESVKRLRGLIQELYDATKAGSGSLNFSKSDFNIDDLVNEVIESVQLANTTHKIKKEGEAMVEVYADRDRINQVLTNYLINAVKYSPQADKVDVKVFIENGDAVVAVNDYGAGIPEEKIPHIFDRYYRADASTKIEGLGLGLYLSKQIIDAHGGRVWIKSKENEGSTFYFSIPV
jgi:PAS domain S-box-containing protein